MRSGTLCDLCLEREKKNTICIMLGKKISDERKSVSEEREKNDDEAKHTVHPILCLCSVNFDYTIS